LFIAMMSRAIAIGNATTMPCAAVPIIVLLLSSSPFGEAPATGAGPLWASSSLLAEDDTFVNDAVPAWPRSGTTAAELS
jgi:hypothetical protein